jgi:hypothetical protein
MEEAIGWVAAPRADASQWENNAGPRYGYCKQSGFYLWIRSPSIQVGKKE